MAVLSLKQITTENQKPGQKKKKEKKTDREESVAKETGTRQCPFSAQSKCSFMLSHLFSYIKITFTYSLIK